MTNRIVKAYMVLKNKTQADMAKALGVTVATFNLKLNGKYYFTPKEMDIIAKELQRPISELFFTDSISEMKTKNARGGK